MVYGIAVHCIKTHSCLYFQGSPEHSVHFSILSLNVAIREVEMEETLTNPPYITLSSFYFAVPLLKVVRVQLPLSFCLLFCSEYIMVKLVPSSHIYW